MENSKPLFQPRCCKRDPSFDVQICKGWLEVASSSSLLKPWKNAWLFSQPAGRKDNFACNSMSQSINSHCGGRRKVCAFCMHFDVLQWGAIVKVEVFSKLLLLCLVLSCRSHFLTFPSFCEASSIMSLSWDAKHAPVSDVIPGVAFGLFPYLSQGMFQWACSSSRGKKRVGCPGKSREEHVEGSGAAGEELGVSGTQASVSQQPNAIAKSQIWSRIALAGLLCARCRK